MRKSESQTSDYGSSTSSASACAVEDMSGNNLTAEELASHRDQLTELVFTSRKDRECPTTFKATVEKILRTHSKIFCDDNLIVAMVSERTMQTDKPDYFRTVFTHNCSMTRNNPDDVDFPLKSDFFMAPLSAIKKGDPLPNNAEFLVFDTMQKVYNYYALEDGRWRYFGNSFDMLKHPGTSKDGSFQNQERRCANCHTGGSPIQKELQPPWINWNGDPRDIPGADDILEQLKAELKQPKLSDPSGEFLQTAVENGIHRWNTKRLQHFKDRGTVKELLQPLFCTMEFNLENGGTVGNLEKQGTDYISVVTDIDRKILVDSGGFNNRSIRYHNFMDFNMVPPIIDDSFHNDGETPSSLTPVYEDVIQNVAHQKMVDDDGHPLIDIHGKKVIDTRFKMIYPTRSTADIDYQEKLGEAGIIDSRLAYAALSADFTRSVFSDARCKLLDFAPELPSTKRTAENIKQGFVKNLQAQKSRTPIEQQFLDDLLSTQDLTPERQHIFLKACAARAKTDLRGLTIDVVKITSQLREKARNFSSIIEHNEVLPIDDLKVSDSARLDPKTCILKN